MGEEMKVYRVQVIKGGRDLKYRETGSKTYSRREHAIKHLYWLRSTGVNAKLLESPEFEWIETDD
jgi:hypothetical protein